MKLLFLGLFLAISSFAAFGQGVTYVTLKQEHLAYTPANIYITDVKDDRGGRQPIGTISTDVRGYDNLELRGGVVPSIKGFIAGRSPDKTKQAIELHVQNMDVVI